jgi:hypothetical protein
MGSVLAWGSRDDRGSLFIIGEGVCDHAGSAAEMIVPATKTDIKIDNEGLMRNICPLSAIRGSAATGGFHLTSSQKHLKYRQGYHPKEELQAEKRNLLSNTIRHARTFALPMRSASAIAMRSKARERNGFVSGM